MAVKEVKKCAARIYFFLMATVDPSSVRNHVSKSSKESLFPALPYSVTSSFTK